MSASTAIPHFFDAAELMIKREDTGEIVPYHPENTQTRYVDGSIAGDLPMQRMSELFNVNTFIVSQVNPYVVPFLSVDGGGVLESRIRKKLSLTIKAIIGNEIKHVIGQLSTLGVLPAGVKRLLNFVTQEYKGHVTILPQPKMIHYRNVLVNPDQKDYEEAIHSSYNSTLQKISLIRAVYGVEREFDRYYMRLKNSLRGSASQIVAQAEEDSKVIEYAVKRTMSRLDAWDEEDHDFEKLGTQHNELVAYISKTHDDRTT